MTAPTVHPWRLLLAVSSLMLGAVATPAHAEPTVAAVLDAAERVGVEPLLLLAIAFEESALHPFALNLAGRPTFPSSADAASQLLTTQPGRTSADIGALQVNSQWIDRLNAHGPMQITPTDLLDPEVGATVGAAVLKSELDATGGDVWRAVARYHTGPDRPGNRERGRRYAESVRRTYDYLQAAIEATARRSTEATP